MRKIKFRGALLNRTVIDWVYGYYIILEDCHFIFDKDGYKHKVDGNSVGMCTDYPDKNGTNIYTKDVLAVSYGHYSPYYEEVVFEEGRFNPLHECCDYDGITLISSNLEIIGNTYENSELLPNTEGG